MKTQIFTLSILALATGFSAEENTHWSECSCCCTSPTPDQTIDCVCFVPQWYYMSGDCGFYLTGDFLYWKGKETNLAYAMKGKTVPNGTDTSGPTDLFFFSPFSLEYVGGHWAPGVRVGLGYKSECDGWDLGIAWTYYQTKKTTSESVPNPVFYLPENDQFAFINQWTNSSYSAFHPFSVNKFVFNLASGFWKFRINNFDLVLGKRYWVSKCFTMRPFAGVRGMWTQTNFKASLTRQDYSDVAQISVTANYAEVDQFDNRVWGIGLIAGFEPAWYFTPCIGIYMSGDIALVWGKHRMKKTERILSSVLGESTDLEELDGKFKSRRNCNAMTPILDLGLGIRLENYFCEGRFHSEVDLGWEDHVLFHLNDRYQVEFTDQFNFDDSSEKGYSFQKFFQTYHDVSFGGIVLRVRLDF